MKIPSILTHKINGRVINNEIRSAFYLKENFDPELFSNAIPQDFLGWAEDLLTALKPNTRNIKWLVGGHGNVNSYQDFVTQVEFSL